MQERTFIVTEYLKYRVDLRGFDLNLVEKIVRYSEERYLDTETNRLIAIGEHNKKLVMIPYEETQDTITPITIHATSRQQIKFRLNTGRFTYE